MSKALVSISTASLRAAPFFILSGPDGRRLSCQWTKPASANGNNSVSEFEIVCPETPEAMGCLFGLFDAAQGTFTMRPAIRRLSCAEADDKDTVQFAPEMNLDLSWQGDLNDVLDTGYDFDMGADGLLIISDLDADLSSVAAAA